MITVGVLELQERASELVRLIMQTDEEVSITDGGEVVVQLVSVKRAKEKMWTTLDHLATQIVVDQNADDHE